MKLSAEKEELVSKNMKLIHYVLKRLGVAPNTEMYEDLESIGKIGLIKAAITFDKSKKNTFATYATTCIKNEIYMYFRKIKKQNDETSLDAPIGEDSDGNELTLEDIIEDDNSNFAEEIVNKDDFIKKINILLNCLSGKARIVILYRLGGLTQEQIGQMLRISRSYVCRIERKVNLKIREITNKKTNFKEVFFMDAVGSKYKLTFSTTEVGKFNEIFAKLLPKLVNSADLPEFKVGQNKERIVVQMPADPEAFSFIAQIIQEIDNYTVAYKRTVPEKTTIENAPKTDNLDEVVKTAEQDLDEGESVLEETDDTSLEKLEYKGFMKLDQLGSDKTKTAKEDSVIESDEDTSTEVESSDSKIVSTDNPISEKNKKDYMAKQVRDYILSKESFTVQELKMQLPDVKQLTIAFVVHRAKGSGLITPLSRGSYKVNKT